MSTLAGRLPRCTFAALLLVFAIGVLTACGGGSSAGTASSGQPASGSAEPSRDFISKGGQNKWATFGIVASDDEREAASKVLEENLRAREAGEWEAQCSSLSRRAMEGLGRAAETKASIKACAKALKGFAEPLNASVKVRKDNLRGEIDVLRVEGRNGVALFHGPDDKNYGMSMEKENGEWKVSSVMTAELN